MEDRILDVLNKSNALPFLFVGTGFSKRYVDMYDWSSLLKLLAQSIDPSNPLIYKQFETTARQIVVDRNQSDEDDTLLLPEVATAIEVEMNKVWFSSEVFEESRKEYSLLDPSMQCSPFKFEVSKMVNKRFLEHKGNFLLPEEIQQLLRLKQSIAGVVTTNYDLLIEELFGDVLVKHIGQENMLLDSDMSIGDLYKIHGCSSCPASIVLTTRDYVDFNTKNVYLAAKLLTLFVEHPIIFIGYSITDGNIRTILENIGRILPKNKSSVLKDRMIFINYSKNGLEEVKSRTISLDKDIQIEMTEFVLSDFSKLYKAIERKKTKYPLKILQMLKKDIYELVVTNDPNSRIQVLDFDNERLANREIVVGVGITALGKKGYRMLTYEELIEDVLFDGDEISATLLIDESLPYINRMSNGAYPIYKYICSYAGELPHTVDKHLKEDYQSFLSRSQKRLITANYTEDFSRFNCIQEVLDSDLMLNGKLDHILALGYLNKITVQELGEFLRNLYRDDSLKILQTNAASSFRKLVKVYDWMKYKK